MSEKDEVKDWLQTLSPDDLGRLREGISDLDSVTQTWGGDVEPSSGGSDTYFATPEGAPERIGPPSVGAVPKPSPIPKPKSASNPVPKPQFGSIPKPGGIPKPKMDFGKKKAQSLPKQSSLSTDVPVGIDRYEELSVLGEGGMGQVLRVRDLVLQRTVAMKVIRADRGRSRALLARFREEAQVASQLQHPGIIPIHDFGLTKDGALYFTMKEVHGREVTDLILRREASPFDGPILRRLLETFRRVCETVAYAHSQRVIHRDLKPDNVMVGDFGEVLVLDWGLAKVLGGLKSDASSFGDPDSSIQSLRQSDDVLKTRAGSISGTPLYMAPEQARGAADEVCAQTDVYALGVILFHILMGEPPFLGTSLKMLLALRADGEPLPELVRKDGAPVDEALADLVVRATAAEIADRPAHAGVMADELAAWLDGAQRRERAMEKVAAADALTEELESVIAQMGSLHEAANEVKTALPKYPKVEEKRPLWAAEDKVADTQLLVEKQGLAKVRMLRAALSHDPMLPEAHDRLAVIFQKGHAEAEDKGDDVAARRLIDELNAHDRGTHTAYLRGVGAVTLVTEPPGAMVRLHRYERKERLLVPVFERELGQTPLVEMPVEMGSYLLTLHHPDCDDVRYPVHITRQHHWDGVNPNGEQIAIRLPPKGTLQENDCYVPPGWFIYGDDEFQPTPPRQRRWLDGFVIGKHPVTVGEYVSYLNRLIDEGREEEALANQPRLSGGDEAFLARDEKGRFTKRRDDLVAFEAVENSLDVPMVFMSGETAVRYCENLAPVGRWSLPTGLEWEKAARGVDGRNYATGDEFDPVYFRVNGVAVERVYVGTNVHPIDESSFGVSGTVGNVQDLIVEQSMFFTRGGSAFNGPQTCRVTPSAKAAPDFRTAITGFRIRTTIFF